MVRHRGKKLPRATHSGEISLGKGVVECAVLEDGTRVISQRGLARAFGAGVPSASRREDKLPALLSTKNLKPFIDDDLRVKSAHIEYSRETGGLAHGIRAEVLPKIFLWRCFGVACITM